MNAEAEQQAMSHKLTAARQNALLSHCAWIDSSCVRMQATLKTEPILRYAGVSHPRVLEWYSVPVKRDNSGFLVIDHDGKKHAPQSESTDELYELGGIFAGEDAGNVDAEHAEKTKVASIPEELEPEMDALCELTKTRTFEIQTGPDSRVRIQIISFEDVSLPSPNEREKWKPRKTINAEVHAAIAALHSCRLLSHYEQL